MFIQLLINLGMLLAHSSALYLSCFNKVSTICNNFSRTSLTALENDRLNEDDMKIEITDSPKFPWNRKSKDRISKSLMNNRMPKDINAAQCICGSSLTYARCCYRLHIGYDDALQPMELLRARFAAFAYRLPLFVIKTTSKTGSEWKSDQSAWESEILEFCDDYRFLGLDIGPERKAGVNVAYLTFTASLELRQRPVRGQVTQVDFTERSRFVKSGARWLYEGGSLLEVNRSNKSTRFDRSDISY